MGTVMPDDGPGAPFTIVGLSATKCVAFKSEPVLREREGAFWGCSQLDITQPALCCEVLIAPPAATGAFLHSVKALKQQQNAPGGTSKWWACRNTAMNGISKGWGRRAADLHARTGRHKRSAGDRVKPGPNG